MPVNWSSIPNATTVVDVITNPRLTPFLQTAREKGCPVVNGVEMLVQLAMQIFRAWTGIEPDEAVFQQAVAAACASLGTDPLGVGWRRRRISGTPGLSVHLQVKRTFPPSITLCDRLPSLALTQSRCSLA